MTIGHSPETSDHLAEFLERHSLRRSSVIEAEIKAIHWASVANILVNHGYARLAEEMFSREPAIGILLNLLHRSFEHLDASIVAFTTGSGSSSEGLSRVTVELSVSILYILAGHREARLLAFFQNYVEGEDKRMGLWSKAVQHLSEPERAEHASAIKHRRSGIAAINQFLTKLRTEVAQSTPGILNESWPSTVAARFDKIGDSAGYRTIYSRMSSQIHSDAEETIRYFMGRTLGDEKVLGRMSMETIWFSKFMVYIAVSYFLRANSAYAKCYAMTEELLLLEAGQHIINAELSLIAKYVDG